MTKPHIEDDMEPVLNLIPLSTAADTIRSFCLGRDNCKRCDLFNLYGAGCYFNNVVPCNWDINSIVYDKTEEVGKNHYNRPGRRFKNADT
jgi:hypothetical protein